MNGEVVPTVTDEHLPAVPTVEEVWNNLDPRKQMFVDYRASGGIRFGQDGIPKRFTLEEFLNLITVGSSTTLYRWEQDIPGFDQLVAWRRPQVIHKRAVSAIYAGQTVAAIKGSTPAAELVLRNFDPAFKSPKQDVEHSADESMMGLFGYMRKAAEVIDGEWTEPTDSGTASVDGSERPPNIPREP